MKIVSTIFQLYPVQLDDEPEVQTPLLLGSRDLCWARLGIIPSNVELGERGSGRRAYHPSGFQVSNKLLGLIPVTLGPKVPWRPIAPASAKVKGP